MLSNSILRRDDQIGCFVFTPIDEAEARLTARNRQRRAGTEPRRLRPDAPRRRCGAGAAALVRSETRKHADLDLDLDADQLGVARRALEELGFRPRRDDSAGLPARLVMRDGRGRFPRSANGKSCEPRRPTGLVARYARSTTRREGS